MNPRTTTDVLAAIVLLEIEADKHPRNASTLRAMIAALEWTLDADTPMVIVEADLANYRWGKTLLTIE
jgi:hypothetical protein